MLILSIMGWVTGHDNAAPAGVALTVEQSAGQVASGQLKRRQLKNPREQATWGIVGGDRQK